MSAFCHLKAFISVTAATFSCDRHHLHPLFRLITVFSVPLCLRGETPFEFDFAILASYRCPHERCQSYPAL